MFFCFLQSITEVFACMNNFHLITENKVGNYYAGYCTNYKEVENSISIFSHETRLNFTKYRRKTHSKGEFGSRGLNIHTQNYVKTVLVTCIVTHFYY